MELPRLRYNGSNCAALRPRKRSACRRHLRRRAHTGEEGGEVTAGKNSECEGGDLNPYGVTR